jgi:hypothetical protein
MEGTCERCGEVGAGYGKGPDPCLGELRIISVCCGHGRERPHVNLRGPRGETYRCEIVEVTAAGYGQVLGSFGSVAEWEAAVLECPQHGPPVPFGRVVSDGV